MSKLISLCMIVRDEEKVLDRCLSSVQGLVDEIVIVDTGSQDRTKEIAAKYTDIIIPFEWNHDFSAARNESLRHATGKWILVLDADEYVQPGDYKELRDMLNSFNPDHAHGFSIRILNLLGDGTNNIMESAGGRLFINHRGVHYIEPIHEQIRSKDGGIVTFSPLELTVFHTGYLNQTFEAKKKSDRNMGILLRMKNKRKNDPYYYFVLANEYKNAEDLDKALYYYKESFKKSKPQDAWYKHLLDRLVQTTIKKGLFRDAYQYILLGKKLWPHFSDYHCLEGIVYAQFGFLKKACACFEKSIEIANLCEKENKPFWLTQINYGRLIPHQMLAEISRKRGDQSSLAYHLTAAVRQDPQNYMMFKSLFQLLSRHDTSSAIIAFIEKLYPLSNIGNLYVLLRTSLSVGHLELSKHYWELCKTKQVPMLNSDKLSYALLNNERVNVEELVDQEQISLDLALASAIIHHDQSYLKLVAPEQYGVATEIYQDLVRALDIDTVSIRITKDNKIHLLNLLGKLKTTNHIETYDRLLSKILDTSFLNSFAEALYMLGYTEDSIEIYSTLLEHQALTAHGYIQMGLLCCIFGNINDGISLFEQAFEAEPSFDVLGFMCEWDHRIPEGFRNKYIRTFPSNQLPEFIFQL